MTNMNILALNSGFQTWELDHVSVCFCVESDVDVENTKFLHPDLESRKKHPTQQHVDGT